MFLLKKLHKTKSRNRDSAPGEADVSTTVRYDNQNAGPSAQPPRGDQPVEIQVAAQEPRHRQESSPQGCRPAIPHDYEQERHGLFVLYPTEEQHVDSSSLTVDIVAVHGLKGSARKTWMDSTTGNCWLEDFLPDAVPRARIMSFSYDSTLAFSKSRAGIDNFALDLLNRLRVLRSISTAQGRPVVFVAHSLGGIVVKKALILAHEAQIFYGSILQSTTGIIFMGTPHRGSDLVPWAALLSNLINIATLGQGIQKSLLNILDANSLVLAEISRQFVQRSAPLKLVTFIEQRIERPLTTLVVPEYSAVLGLPNELIVPLNAHHRSLCRYADRTSQNYLLVEAAIKEIVFGEMHSDEKKLRNLLAVYAGDLECISSTLSPSYVDGAFEDFTRRSDAKGDLSSSALASATPSITAVNSISSRIFPESTATSFSSSEAKPASFQSRSIKPSISPKPDSSDSLITFRALGLRKKLSVESYGRRNVTCTFRIPADTVLHDVRQHLLTGMPEVVVSERLTFSVFGHAVRFTWQDVFTTSVEVTAGKSCYNLSKGLKINSAQPIAAFFSKVFPRPIEAALEGQGQASDTSPFSKVSSGSVALGRGEVKDLTISFMRTVRVPEDGKTHHLPPGMGRFPLFNVRPFSNLLWPDMVAKGGLFLPIYQMEALWIYFTGKDSKYAIRPYVGGINGITGETTRTGGMSSYLRRMNNSLPKQDYLVLPEQRWLDGIAASPGIVKQFVATEMAADQEDVDKGKARKTISSKHQENMASKKPAGSSIEWQLTGRDEVGGVQLQIIPLFDVDAMSATSMKNVCRSMLAPDEEGLQIGDTIHLKDMNSTSKDRTKTARDLHNESHTPVSCNDVIDIVIHASGAVSWEFHISVYGQPEKAVSLTVFEDDSFDDILAVVRDKLDLVDGSLLMPCSTLNDPDALFPLFRPSWVDFHFVRRAMSDSFGCKLGSETQGDGCKCDFTWVLSGDQFRRVCCISATEDAARHFPLLKNSPAFLSLHKDATIADLHTELESISGVSVANYQIMKSTSYGWTSLDEKVIDDAEQVDCSIPRLILHDGFNLIAEKQLHILVKTVQGSTLTLERKPTDKVGDLENMLQKEHRVVMNQKVLSFAGTLLSTNDVLGAIGVSQGSTIHIVRKPTATASGIANCVYIETLTGKTIKFSLQPNQTVLGLKHSMQDAEGIPPDQQRLIFDGKWMENERLLSDYGIKPGSVIYLHLSLRGGALSLSVRYKRAVHHLFPDGDTIGHLKLNILSHFGIPIKGQVLKIGNNIISDDRKCVDIRPNTVIDLIAKAEERATALAIGAGGRIIQHIEPDKTDPRLWDVASSKVLNIQFLDSRTFRQVTNLAPPKTPITADTYLKLGLPFYKLWRDEAEAPGIAGEWDNVKSVMSMAAANMGHDSSSNSASTAPHDPLKWGLLRSGAWGDLDAEESGSILGPENFKEPGLVFPVVMLDIDDTMPKFKSAVVSDDDSNDDEY